MTLLTGDLLDSSKVKANQVDEPALNTGHHDIPLSCNINRCDGSLTKGSRGFFFVCSQTSFNICFLYIEVKVVRYHFCRMCWNWNGILKGSDIGEKFEIYYFLKLAKYYPLFSR